MGFSPIIKRYTPIALAKTSAFTASIGVDKYFLSGASFNITLPSALGCAGAMISFYHQGTNFTQTYTFLTTGGQTVNGVVSGSWVMQTNGQVVSLISNGTNWLVEKHVNSAGWIDCGAIVLTASTTNPTLPTTVTYNKLFVMRVGDTGFFKGSMHWGSAAGAAAGSGSYFIEMPSGIVLSPLVTSANITTENESAAASLGTAAFILDAGTQAIHFTYAYSTTKIATWMPGTGNWGSGYFAVNNNNLGAAFNFHCRVVGWQP